MHSTQKALGHHIVSSFFRQAVPVAKVTHSLTFSKTKSCLEKKAQQKGIDPRGHPEPTIPTAVPPHPVPCLGWYKLPWEQRQVTVIPRSLMSSLI